MINFLKRIIFGKKEEKKVEFPFEFVTINYTKQARKYGVFENFTKEICLYAGTEYISYPFIGDLVEGFKNMGLPVYDMTKKVLELPIKRLINPQLLVYKRVKDENG